jgi:hypothetical protein
VIVHLIVQLIVHLIVQLISPSFGAYNPLEFVLYILNLVPNKWNALIKILLRSWFHYPLDREMKHAKAPTRFTGTRV